MLTLSEKDYRNIIDILGDKRAQLFYCLYQLSEPTEGITAGLYAIDINQLQKQKHGYQERDTLERQLRQFEKEDFLFIEDDTKATWLISYPEHILRNNDSDQPPTANPATEAPKATYMNDDWQVPTSTWKALIDAGYSEQWLKTTQLEFMRYWQQRKEAKNDWEIKFIQWVRTNCPEKTISQLLTKDWQPSTLCYENIKKQAIPTEFAEEYLNEFKLKYQNHTHHNLDYQFFLEVQQKWQEEHTASQHSDTSWYDPEQHKAEGVHTINQIFWQLSLNYPVWYHKQWPSHKHIMAAKRLWYEHLHPLPPNIIWQAHQQLLGQSAFIPTIADMKKACHQLMLGEHYPPPEAAFQEAINARPPRDTFAWSHPIIYQAGCKTGWHHLESDPEDIVFPQFLKHYNTLTEAFIQSQITHSNTH